MRAVPVVCFGARLTAPGLIRRLGMNMLLRLTLIAVAVGSGMRLVRSLAALFVGTAVVGAGIAVANVLLPGLIKRDFSGHSHLAATRPVGHRSPVRLVIEPAAGQPPGPAGRAGAGALGRRAWPELLEVLGLSEALSG